MSRGLRFAKWTYVVAGVYGLIALLPQYFLEEKIGHDFPPPITHPEHFYGFVGVAIAWQLAFLIIASDVRRFRPLMPVTVVEKLAFAVPVSVLFARGRVPIEVLAFGMIDLVLGTLFLTAFIVTRTPSSDQLRTS